MVWPSRSVSRSRWGTSSPCGRSKRGSRSASTARSSALLRAPSPPVRTSTPTTCGRTSSSAVYAGAPDCPPLPPADAVRTFQGYLRPDGRVGTRNMIAVISTVNCSASTSRMIADHFRDGRWKRDFPNVDGVFSITHKGGCGLPFGGLDHQILERVLAGFAHHPNVAAYVIVGLGCEGAHAAHLVETHHLTLLGSPADGTTMPSSTGLGSRLTRSHRAEHPGPGGDHAYGRGRGPRRARPLARGELVAADRAAGLKTLPGHGVRRVRRQLGHHGQPGAGRGGRPADRPGGIGRAR